MASSLSSPSIDIATTNNDAATEALIARLIAEDLDGDNAASAFSNDAPPQGEPSAMTWGGDDDENSKDGIYDDGDIVGEEVESTGRWDEAVAGGSSVLSGSTSSNWQWGNTTAAANNTTILPIRDAQQQQHNQEADIRGPIATTTTAGDGDLSTTTATATATATVEDDAKIAARSNPKRKERGKEREIVILEESPYNEEEDDDGDDDDSFDEPYDSDYDDGHVDLTLIIGRKFLPFPLFP